MKENNPSRIKAQQIKWLQMKSHHFIKGGKNSPVAVPQVSKMSSPLDDSLRTPQNQDLEHITRQQFLKQDNSSNSRNNSPQLFPRRGPTPLTRKSMRSNIEEIFDSLDQKYASFTKMENEHLIKPSSREPTVSFRYKACSRQGGQHGSSGGDQERAKSREHDANYYQLKITKFVNEINAGQTSTEAPGPIFQNPKNTRYMHERLSQQRKSQQKKTRNQQERRSLMRTNLNKSQALEDHQQGSLVIGKLPGLFDNYSQRFDQENRWLVKLLNNKDITNIPLFPRRKEVSESDDRKTKSQMSTRKKSPFFKTRQKAIEDYFYQDIMPPSKKTDTSMIACGDSIIGSAADSGKVSAAPDSMVETSRKEELKRVAQLRQKANWSNLTHFDRDKSREKVRTSMNMSMMTSQNRITPLGFAKVQDPKKILDSLVRHSKHGRKTSWDEGHSSGLEDDPIPSMQNSQIQSMLGSSMKEKEGEKRLSTNPDTLKPQDELNPSFAFMRMKMTENMWNKERLAKQKTKVKIMESMYRQNMEKKYLANIRKTNLQQDRLNKMTKEQKEAQELNGGQSQRLLIMNQNKPNKQIHLSKDDLEELFKNYNSALPAAASILEDKQQILAGASPMELQAISNSSDLENLRLFQQVDTALDKYLKKNNIQSKEHPPQISTGFPTAGEGPSQTEGKISIFENTQQTKQSPYSQTRIRITHKKARGSDSIPPWKSRNKSLLTAEITGTKVKYVSPKGNAGGRWKKPKPMSKRQSEPHLNQQPQPLKPDAIQDSKSDIELINQIQRIEEMGKIDGFPQSLEADAVGEEQLDRYRGSSAGQSGPDRSMGLSNKNDDEQYDQTQHLNSHTNQNSERVLKTSGGLRAFKGKQTQGSMRVGKSVTMPESEIVSCKAYKKKKMSMERISQSQQKSRDKISGNFASSKENDSKKLNIKMNFKNQRLKTTDPDNPDTQRRQDTRKTRKSEQPEGKFLQGRNIEFGEPPPERLSTLYRNSQIQANIRINNMNINDASPLPEGHQSSTETKYRSRIYSSFSQQQQHHAITLIQQELKPVEVEGRNSHLNPKGSTNSGKSTVRVNQSTNEKAPKTATAGSPEIYTKGPLSRRTFNLLQPTVSQIQQKNRRQHMTTLVHGVTPEELSHRKRMTIQEICQASSLKSGRYSNEGQVTEVPEYSTLQIQGEIPQEPKFAKGTITRGTRKAPVIFQFKKALEGIPGVHSISIHSGKSSIGVETGKIIKPTIYQQRVFLRDGGEQLNQDIQFQSYEIDTSRIHSMQQNASKPVSNQKSPMMSPPQKVIIMQKASQAGEPFDDRYQAHSRQNNRDHILIHSKNSDYLSRKKGWNFLGVQVFDSQKAFVQMRSEKSRTRSREREQRRGNESTKLNNRRTSLDSSNKESIRSHNPYKPKVKFGKLNHQNTVGDKNFSVQGEEKKLEFILTSLV